MKEIRPLLEFGVPIWNSGLTKAQAGNIENIQKVALKSIMDDSYLKNVLIPEVTNLWCLRKC